MICNWLSKRIRQNGREDLHFFWLVCCWDIPGEHSIFAATGKKVYKRGYSKHKIDGRDHQRSLTDGLNVFSRTNKEKRYLKLPPSPPPKTHPASQEVFSAERVTKV